MARIAKNQMKTCFFHNMTQGINKEYIFQNNKCKEKYIKLIKDNAQEFKIQIIAYVIMDNHTHLLIQTEEINNMSLYMKKINEKYAMYYNYINNRVGVVFRNRYKTQPIYNQKQLINCIKYIFNNPVRAKMVLNPEDYIYSNSKEFQIEQFLSNIPEKTINYKNENNEKPLYENEFIDTLEDRESFIRELIMNYQNKNNLSMTSRKKEIGKMIKHIKEETNIPNRILAEILNISKATIKYHSKK